MRTDRRRARLFIHPTSPPCWERTSEAAAQAARDRLAEVAVPPGPLDVLRANTDRLFPALASRP